MISWIDTHVHLQDDRYDDDLEAVLELSLIHILNQAYDGVNMAVQVL